MDLTRDEESPISSPTHKVQVVEQRSNLSVAQGAGALKSATPHNEPSRMDKLEAVVADHGEQLFFIKASVGHTGNQYTL